MTVVNGNLLDIIGGVPSQGRIWFSLARPNWNEATGAVFVPEFTQVAANVSTGAFTVDLAPTDAMDLDAVYRATLKYRDTVSGQDKEFIAGSFSVPTSGGPFQLSDLLVSGPFLPVPQDILALVMASQVSAAASAAAAAGDAAAAALYAPAYYPSTAAFFAASTVWANGTRINARTGEVWDVVAAGTGHFNHPVSGIGLTVVRIENTLMLSAFGIFGAGNDTPKIVAFVAAIQAGDRALINVPATYTATSGMDITANDVTLECIGNGSITAPNISNATNAFLFRPTGLQLTNLSVDTGHNIENGEWFLRLLDVSAIQPGDIIGTFTDILFNGSGVDGFFPVYHQHWQQVRRTEAGSVNFTTAYWFNATGAQVSRVEHWRPIKNFRAVNPRFFGPANGIADGVTNGNGARCFLVRGSTGYRSIGGNVTGFPGYINQIVRYIDARVDGMIMNSGEIAPTTQAYYGVVHEGGDGGVVQNCIGRNIRRVADTGGGSGADAFGLLAINTEHHNIRGEFCNGTAAGTHQGQGYNYTDIMAISCAGSGMVIRSRDNNGDGLTAINCGGQALYYFGLSTDPLVNLGKCVQRRLAVRGGRDAAGTRGAAVRIDGNGSYDIEGEMDDHTNQGILVTAKRISGLKVRGSMNGNACSSNIFLEGQEVLSGLDIQGMQMNGATVADILVCGTALGGQPARNIRISDNVCNSAVTFPILINPAANARGMIEGETTTISNNTGNGGDGLALLDIGLPRFMTAAPAISNNRKVKSANGSDVFDRGINEPIRIGMFANVAGITAQTTILDGDWFEVTNPAAGAYPRYDATFSGTTGTLSGVTAGITSGSNIATLVGNSAGGVYQGSIITIAGSGISVYRVRLLSADGATATLSSNAVTTVSGAAVGYRAPTFKGRGILEA